MCRLRRELNGHSLPVNRLSCASKQKLSNDCPSGSAKNHFCDCSGSYHDRSFVGFKAASFNQGLAKNVASAWEHFFEGEFACRIGFGFEMKGYKAEAAS